MSFYSTYSYIDTISVFLLLLLSLYLVTARAVKPSENRLLAAALFALAMGYMDGVFLTFGYHFHQDWGHIVHATMSFDFLVGPLLYLYMLSRTTKDFRLTPLKYLHLLPFILHLSFIYGSAFTHSVATSSSLFSTNTLFSTGQIKILTTISNLFYASYMLLILASLIRYQRTLKQQHSNVERKNLMWLRLICTALFFSGVLRYANNLWWLQAPMDPWHNYLDLKLFAITGVMVFATTAVFQTMRNSVTLKITTQELQQNIPTTHEQQKSKYEHSPLDDSMMVELKNRVMAYMHKEKSYLESDLNLKDLAEALKMSSHHLSQVMNAGFGKNFFDFINELRIEEAQRQLSDPTNENTIAHIMCESGFNSKSVFNTLFKKTTHMTPTQFRKQQQSSLRTG